MPRTKFLNNKHQILYAKVNCLMQCCMGEINYHTHLRDQDWCDKETVIDRQKGGSKRRLVY